MFRAGTHLLGPFTIGAVEGDGKSLEPLLTSIEVGKKLKVAHKTLNEWAAKGYLPAIPVGIGRRKQGQFWGPDIDHWLEEQQKLVNGEHTSKKKGGAADSGCVVPLFEVPHVKLAINGGRK